jgi:hypothetical protein
MAVAVCGVINMLYKTQLYRYGSGGEVFRGREDDDLEMLTTYPQGQIICSRYAVLYCVMHCCAHSLLQAHPFVLHSLLSFIIE